MEIQDDIMKFIKELKFTDLSQCISNMKWAERGKSTFISTESLLLDIKTNKRISCLIGFKIPIEIQFDYRKEKKFSITKSAMTNKQIDMFDRVYLS